MADTAETSDLSFSVSPTKSFTSQDEEKISFFEQKAAGVKPTTKLYKRRWLILAIFCCYSFSSAFQWIHLNIIGNSVIKFYNESLPEDPSNKQLAVDWLSIIYMVTFVPLTFPAMYILNRKGLHFCAIVGSSMTAIGAWIKAGAIQPDSYGLLFAGQTVVAIAQVFILSLPAHLAATWFSENEVSTATAIGVFGNQLGIAAGFLIPPVIVTAAGDDLNALALQLRWLLIGTAAFCTLVFFAILLFFRAKPPVPPSLSAQAKSVDETVASPMEFLRSLRRLFSNRNFLILMITYGINTGTFYAVSTLLNPLMVYYFPGKDEHYGLIGLTMILAGVAGSIVGGFLLDRTKQFKATTIGFYIFSVSGMLGFTIFLQLLPELWLIYGIVALLGFFMTGYLPVGFEFAVEVTYPEPESCSSSALNVSAAILGFVLTTAMSKVLTMVSCLAANTAMVVLLVVGTGMTFFIKSDLRRQRANKHLANVASKL